MQNAKRGFARTVLFAAALLGALAAGCSGGGGGQDPILGTGVATLAPAASAVAPLPGATGVALNAKVITVAFSRPMDRATLTTASLTLACPAGTPPIPGTVDYLAATNSATFTIPAATTLPPNIVCTVTVTTAARDTTGVPLAADFVSTFTTGPGTDVTAPTVSSTQPLSNATGVSLGSSVIANFSEPMDPATITAANFTLACPAAAPIPGTVSYAVNGNAAVFRPTSNLPANTACTATVTTGVRDVAGNAMAAAFSWTFTTGSTNDTTAPTVSSTVPVANATGVSRNSVVSASFSEAMDPLTITNANFTLACPAGTPVAGTVTYAVNGNVASFRPTSALPASTVCTATIGTGVRDVAGNPMGAPFTWSFTTGATTDTTAPTVSSTVPVVGATGVAVNSRVTASFSEPMDPLTINTATFALACPAGTPVTGTVGYTAVGNVATFTPTGNLRANIVCTATLTTGVRDVAGNAMAAPFTWTFTTGAAPDTTSPTVTSTVPVAGATGVAVNSSVTATFSEPMDPLTVTAATFTLACPAGTPISGAVGYAVNGNVATFTPAGNLPANVVCTATISTGVRDVAGNSMAAPFTWTFTTGAAADTLAPTVTSTNPVNLAVGVCTNKTINATFSEAMDPLTITTATFTLAQTAGGAPVVGVVAYDALTRIATFDPVTNLTGTPATNYTATIRGGANGVKDVAGNPLAADSVTTFTTNASTCTTAPVLGAAAPFGGFGGSATVTNDGLNTVINGDIGASAASSSITGLRDSGGNVYTITPTNNGLVNGLVHTLTAPPGSVAGAVVTAARANALVAFNSISPAALPGGIDVSSPAQCPSCGGAGEGPGRLAGRTLPPGVYLSTIGTYDIGGLGAVQKILTLDAGGDPNAVFVFQTAAGTGTLTVGLTGPATPAVPVQVLLINGAQSKNVFWYVPSGATIGTGATMVGTLLADGSITMSTTGGGPPPSAVTTTLNGRAIVLTAGFTMTNSVINVPAP